MLADWLRILELSALASSAAILLVLLLRKPMRTHFGAHTAYALWLLVPLAAAVALLPAPVASMAMQIMPLSAVPALIPVAPAVPVVNAFDPLPWLGVAWALGLAISLAVLAWQQRRFVRALGRLSVVGERIVRAEATAGCPALVGAWQPRVVLPADFERRYSAAERDLILAHERAHCARGDAQLNVFAALLRCLFWFNPLVHIAASRFRFDQELACDAAVIARFPEARRPYADAMLKTQLADIGLPAGCYWQSSHPLKERISMLKQPLPGRARRVLGIAVACSLILSGSYAAWAMQPAQSKSVNSTKPANAPVDVACCVGDVHASYRKLSRITYPEAALAAKVQGVVYVKVHIGVDGKVLSASAERVDPSSAAALSESAVAGVKTWTFNPATKDGKPVTNDEVVPIAFALDRNAPPRVEGATLDAIVVSPPEALSEQSSAPSENVEFRKNATFAPKYPAAALAAHQSGKIVLKVSVDAQGNPQSAVVDTAEPPEAETIFGDTAIASVMQWRFNPGVRDGKPVGGDVLVPFTFSLRDED
jgi:TonB family protein